MYLISLTSCFLKSAHIHTRTSLLLKKKSFLLYYTILHYNSPVFESKRELKKLGLVFKEQKRENNRLSSSS